MAFFPLGNPGSLVTSLHCSGHAFLVLCNNALLSSLPPGWLRQQEGGSLHLADSFVLIATSSDPYTHTGATHWSCSLSSLSSVVGAQLSPWEYPPWAVAGRRRRGNRGLIYVAWGPFFFPFLPPTELNPKQMNSLTRSWVLMELIIWLQSPNSVTTSILASVRLHYYFHLFSLLSAFSNEMELKLLQFVTRFLY